MAFLFILFCFLLLLLLFYSSLFYYFLLFLFIFFFLSYFFFFFFFFFFLSFLLPIGTLGAMLPDCGISWVTSLIFWMKSIETAGN